MDETKWKVMVIQANRKVYFSWHDGLKEPSEGALLLSYDEAAELSKIIVKNNLVGITQVRIISDQFGKVGA